MNPQPKIRRGDKKRCKSQFARINKNSNNILIILYIKITI